MCSINGVSHAVIYLYFAAHNWRRVQTRQLHTDNMDKPNNITQGPRGTIKPGTAVLYQVIVQSPINTLMIIRRWGEGLAIINFM